MRFLYRSFLTAKLVNFFGIIIILYKKIIKKINDDFDTNYDIINLISKTNDINTIKTLITSLIAKNICFLENDRSVIKIEED